MPFIGKTMYFANYNHLLIIDCELVMFF